jgi:hypothetical protein
MIFLLIQKCNMLCLLYIFLHRYSCIFVLSWIPSVDNSRKKIYIHKDGVKRHFQQYFSYFAWSVLLVEETGVPGENHRPVANYGQTLSHNVISSSLSRKLS